MTSHEITDNELCCRCCGNDTNINNKFCPECGDTLDLVTKLQFRKAITEFIEMQSAKLN